MSDAARVKSAHIEIESLCRAPGPGGQVAPRSKASRSTLGTAETALVLNALTGYRAWLRGAGLTSPGSVAGCRAGDQLLAEIEDLCIRWAAHAKARRPLVLLSIGPLERDRLVSALEVMVEEIDSLALFVRTIGGAGGTAARGTSGVMMGLISKLTQDCLISPKSGRETS